MVQSSASSIVNMSLVEREQGELVTNLIKGIDNVKNTSNKEIIKEYYKFLQDG